MKNKRSQESFEKSQEGKKKESKPKRQKTFKEKEQFQHVKTAKKKDSLSKPLKKIQKRQNHQRNLEFHQDDTFKGKITKKVKKELMTESQLNDEEEIVEQQNEKKKQPAATAKQKIQSKIQLITPANKIIELQGQNLMEIRVQQKEDNSVQSIMDNEVQISQEEKLQKRANLALRIYKLGINVNQREGINKNDKEELANQTYYQQIMSIINETEYLDQEQIEGNELSEVSSSKKHNKNIKEEKQIQRKKRFKHHKQVRRPFIDLFQEGINVKDRIFNQERISFGKMNSQKFIFHPTYLITGQMFKTIFDLNSRTRVLTGTRGISKTVSVLLCWQLVRIIDQYRFKHFGKISKQIREVPKIFYWSISCNPEFQDVKRIIFDQCPQLIQKQPKLDFSDALDFSIQKLYDQHYEGIKSILLIDQINTIASIGRIFENQIKQDLKKYHKSQIQLQKVKDLNLKFFWKLKWQIEYLVGRFHKKIFMSSINIEELFYKQIEIQPDRQELNPMLSFTQEIKYASILFQKSTIVQLIQYFLFEITVRLEITQSSSIVKTKSKLTQVKRQCYDFLLNKIKTKEYFFFTPCDIRLFVSELKQQINGKYKTLNDLKNQILPFFIFFVNNSTENFKNQLVDYLQKKYSKDQADQLRESKILVNHELYNIIVAKIASRNKGENSFLPNSISTDQLTFPANWLSKLLDNRLFSFKRGFGYIFATLPFQFLKIIMNPFIFKRIKLNSIAIINYANKVKGKTDIGSMVENHLILALQKGEVKFFFRTRDENAQNEMKKYMFDIKKQGILRFQHLQRNYQQRKSRDVFILNRFKQNMIAMSKNKIEHAVSFPVARDFSNKKPFEINDIVCNSKLIDLAVISSVAQSNRVNFEIFLIDVTTSSTLTQNKIINFVEQFLKFEDRNVTQFEYEDKIFKVDLNYLVLNTKNDVDKKKIERQLNIKYKKQITFKTFNKSNVFTVSQLHKAKQCLLKRIGYINLGEDFIFQQYNEQSVQPIQTLYGLINKTHPPSSE